MHVLKTDGTPYSNVFAAGETSPSLFFGDYYIISFSLGLYSAHGRIIGQPTASEFKTK